MRGCVVKRRFWLSYKSSLYKLFGSEMPCSLHAVTFRLELEGWLAPEFEGEEDEPEEPLDARFCKSCCRAAKAVWALLRFPDCKACASELKSCSTALACWGFTK